MKIIAEDEKELVKIVLNAINDFENGDDSRYDDILYIIKGINNSKKKMNHTLFVEKIIVSLSKTLSNLYGLTDKTAKMYSTCNAYLEYYQECINTLSKYLEVGKKTGDYPDLQAAYLLTLYLTFIIENINDYLDEIKQIEKSSLSSYSYSGNPNIDKKCEERKEKVAALVNSIKRDNNV